MKVVWTPRALLRLEIIERTVALDHPAAAGRLVTQLIERAAALSRFPAIGRRVPERPGTQLRELIEGPYRLIYRVERGARVLVLTVFHAHRSLPSTDVDD